MMTTTRWVVVATTVFTLGCAAFRSSPGDVEHAVLVQVENDLTRRADVTVRMVDNTGAARVLGGVPPGREGVFGYSQRRFSGTYVLTATTGSGRVIVSRTFTLFPQATVVWQIQRNQLRVLREGVEPEGVIP
jgi:hypothetical protein